MQTMNNLIKKSEIGPILGKCESNGWHIINRYQKRTGEKLPAVLVKSNVDGGSGKPFCVAFKVADISKVIEMSQSQIRDRLHYLRAKTGEPLQLTIYKPKK
jgi:hypothetical protein